MMREIYILSAPSFPAALSSVLTILGINNVIRRDYVWFVRGIFTALVRGGVKVYVLRVWFYDVLVWRWVRS